MRLTHRLLIVPLLFLPLLLSGCWSAKEIHKLGIVNTMGIDVNDAGEFEITTVIIKPSILFPQSIGGMEEKNNKYLIETATGRTILEALGKLSKSISNRIYFGHLDMVVFGDKAAREQLLPTLDFIVRENEFRPNIYLLVTKGKAADLVTTTPEFNKTLGLETTNLMKSNHYVATKMVKDISQFMKLYSSNTTDPITGVLTTADKIGVNAKGDDHHAATEIQNKPRVISLDGVAVFKKEGLKGYLNEKQTRGLLWLRGELKNEIMVMNPDTNEKDKVSIVIRNSKSQFIPQVSGNSVKMIVKTWVDADIGEVSSKSLQLDTNQIERLNWQLEELIKKEEASALELAQKEWQTDIFGFGQAIYRTEPRVWDLLAPNWRNGGLRDMTVDLKVKANICRYGLLKNPSNANESR
ncbi:MAG TPA: Ger(x)C family spore germination protein [Bacillales bacterium]|nr:Ger(x)C family spore germination protein [Bacillales bacterium]